MRIRYNDGSSVYAWMLSLAGVVMRVAVKECGDALELRLENGAWVAEDGRAATFEFPFNLGGAAGFLASMEHMLADPAMRQACGGTGECVVRQLLQGTYTPQS